MKRLRVVDSHTGGEPTRVVIGEELPGATMLERRATLTGEWDWLRSGIVCEPRGSDILVGAWLTPPISEDAAAGIVFFNTVGGLGMCGHGLIGVVETLSFLGDIAPGVHKFDTPAGLVTVELHEDGKVAFENVESYVWRKDVALTVNGKAVTGDVAYGGNWFFLVHEPRDCVESNREALLHESTEIRCELERNGITGEGGAEIDHIEFYGAGEPGYSDSRNFVLCPGGAYDRSPCGTGTSAKLAVLADRGELREGDVWRQASITNSVFDGSYRGSASGRGIIPRIVGSAHVVAESTLYFSEDDPLRAGRLG